MAEEAKNSPLPWESENNIVVCKKWDHTVALCENDSHLTIADEEANAEFIAKACNCHKFLIDALQNATNAIECQVKLLKLQYSPQNLLTSAWVAAKDALADAKEK